MWTTSTARILERLSPTFEDFPFAAIVCGSFSEPVKLVADHDLEENLVRVPDHLLELGPFVGGGALRVVGVVSMIGVMVPFRDRHNSPWIKSKTIDTPSIA